MMKREEDIVISSSLYTHTHTHKTDEPQQQQVKTLCPKTHRNVMLTLEDAKRTKREVEGKPADCRFFPLTNPVEVCSFKMCARCYLRALHYKGRAN